MPVEDDARVGHEYWYENCGRFMNVCSTHPIQLDCVGPDDRVRTPGPPTGQCPIYETMQIDLLDHLRIVEIVDKAKLGAMDGLPSIPP